MDQQKVLWVAVELIKADPDRPFSRNKMDKTMKVNWGYITEFPDITVNLFHPGNLEWNTARAFFLTHVDDPELLESVLNMNFLRMLNEGESQTHRLYLHEISYSFLVYYATMHELYFPNVTGLLDHLKKTGRIVCLKKNIPIRLNFVKPGVSCCPLEVTPLSAGSSPGSIMLLIEQLGGADCVLYTGNCRVIMKDLKYCQPLFDIYGNLKKITRLYIDTTFCTKQIEELPVRRTVIEEALEDATDKVHKDPTTKIQIKSRFPLDGLHFLRCLYEETKEKVHMSEDLYNKFVKGIPSLAPVATTASGLQTLFHFHYACDMRRDKDCGGTAGDEMFDIALLGSIHDLPLEERPKTYTNFYSTHFSRFEMARFINTARAFFLTHVDDPELLESVLNMNFLRMLNEGESQTHRLYLHEISYSFLVYYATMHELYFPNVTGLLDHLKKTGRIVCLKKNIPIRLNFVKPGVSCCPLEVTPLSAGSSPGSIMLLIEQLGGADCVLYTGNCRVIMKDLKYCQPLFDIYGNLKKITRLYIDTTFCTKQIEELPVRRTVIEEALEDATDKVHKDPTTKIQIKSRFPLDGLHFLRCLYEETKEKVHMSEDLYNKFVKGIPSLAPVATTASGLQTLFHFHYACDMRRDKDCGGTAGDEMFDIALLGSIHDLPLEERPKTYTNFYSTHFSRFEMARFINFFQISPKFVVPLYVPPGMYLQDVEVLIHLSCMSVEEEPEELGIDYPSQFHDFTGCSTLFNRDYYKIPRPYFLHRDCPSNFFPPLNHFYVRRAPFFPIENIPMEEFMPQEHSIMPLLM